MSSKKHTVSAPKGFSVVACVDAYADTSAACSVFFLSEQNTHHIINHVTIQINNLASVWILHEEKLYDPQCELV